MHFAADVVSKGYQLFTNHTCEEDMNDYNVNYNKVSPAFERVHGNWAAGVSKL